MVAVPIQNPVKSILFFMFEYIWKTTTKKKHFAELPIAISSTKCLEFPYS